MGPDIFDLVIVLLLLFFTARGLSEGLIGEVAGIVAVIGGIWAVRVWAGAFTPQLTFIADPSWRYLAACVIIFFAVMLAIGLAARLLKKIVALSFAGWLNRLCGALFGFAKGLLIVALLVIALQKLFPQAPFMQGSRALVYLQGIMDWLSGWLPPDLAQHLSLKG